jgi:hypothetical protein
VVLFDREAPLELQIQDEKLGMKEIGSLEAIRVKILMLVSFDFKIITMIGWYWQKSNRKRAC